MEAQVKRKITARVQYHASAPPSPKTEVPPESRSTTSRAGSPTKPKSPLLPNVTVRPKAKINSSATVLRKTPSTKSIASTSSRINSPATPRPGTPQTPSLPPPRDEGQSPRSQLGATVRSSLRLDETRSTPSSPDPSRTAVSTPEPRPTIWPKNRHDSLSLNHVASLSTLSNRSRASSLTSSDFASLLDQEKSGDPPPIRVRAKVSSLAKNLESSPPPSAPNPPPYATVGRPRRVHTHTPSISRFPATQTPPPPSPPEPVTFYPITTASPAANPHRFAQSRPTATSHYYQGPPLGNATSSDGNANAIKPKPSHVFARVDPAMIPLPPQSPPSSALSFSSRSSLSGESPSTVSLGNQSSDRHSMRKTSGVRLSIDSFVSSNGVVCEEVASPVGEDATRVDPDDPIHKVKAEAKSNRKIADLEITNRSLLAINSSLEMTRHRQTKEIRELRRKLRESRLPLPPHMYRAVSHEDEVGDDEEEDEEEDPGKDDDAYMRVKIILEALLESGRRALETKPADLVGTSKGGAKVLSAEEVRDLEGLDEHNGAATQSLPSKSGSPSDVDDDSSDEEGEAPVAKPGSTSTPPPTIHVVHDL